MIIQMLPTLSFGDAVSNDCIALEKVLKSMGFKTAIYAAHIDHRLPKGVVKDVKKLPELGPDDIVIYHMSTGDKLNWDFGKLNCKKVMRYHNITPPNMLISYNSDAAGICADGLRALKWLSDKVDYCIAVSEFNKNDLIKVGFKCKIDVMPILIPFDDYKKKPDDITVRRYSDGRTNILFTGRIAPNKCQQDVIKAFTYYKRYFDEGARLFLVGSDLGYENYKRKLERYINLLGVEDVYFAGHISFDKILAYYKVADLFLCQSEHEGFGVPLVESMFFDIPVGAYDSTAIYDTLGGSGFILENKDYVETAAVMNEIIKDKELAAKIVANQREVLKKYDHALISEQFKTLLKENVING